MNLNMASLKKKQAKMAAARSTEMRFEAPNGPGNSVKDPEEKSEIPPWKKELMMSKRGKSVKATSNTGQYQCLKLSFLYTITSDLRSKEGVKVLLGR